MRKPDDPIASTESDPGESFYGRWSRRKNRARHDAVPVEQADAAGSGDDASVQLQEVPAAAPPGLAEPGDAGAGAAERVLTDADMPSLESLGEDDDYSGFMSPGVSEALRNQALRKLFMSSKFNVVDGLNDYDEDFRSFEALGDIVTADMRHRVEVEAERAREKAEEELRALVDEGDAGEEPAGRDDAQDALAMQAGGPRPGGAAGQAGVPDRPSPSLPPTPEVARDDVPEPDNEPRGHDV